MNFSRQALLGIGMILGGSVMLYAMVQQIGASDEQVSAPVVVEQAEVVPDTSRPLTTDIDTETRLLAQKQQERIARVKDQEQRAEQFLTEQESAEAQALAKSRAENQRYIDNTTPPVDVDSDASATTQTVIATPQVQPRVDKVETPVTPKPKPSTNASTTNDEAKKAVQAKQAAAKKSAEEAAQKTEQLKKQADAELAATKKAAQKAEDDKKAAEVAKTEPPRAPTDYKVQSGDGLIKLARQYNVPVAALAQANNTSPSASLQLGQTITIPSRKQIQRLEREAAEAEKARAAEQAKAEKSAKDRREAQQKLRDARKEVIETDAKGSFGVQVSLASNQAKADEVAKKFKAAGYDVKTSATSRGVRVVVGPERGKIAALALKDKVNSDPKVDTTGAWVLYW